MNLSCVLSFSNAITTCMKYIKHTGTFTSAEIAISVIISSILILVLFAIIGGVVSVLLYNKYRRITGQSPPQPPTELKEVGPISEETILVH